jgi:dynein intermediate chain
MREKRHGNPVLKSNFNGLGHDHPLYSLQLSSSTSSGTTSTPQQLQQQTLMTCSNDGRFCAWKMDLLAQQPLQTLDLSCLPTSSSSSSSLSLASTKSLVMDSVGVTCFDFPRGLGSEPGVFWIGTEEGRVFEAHRFERAGWYEYLLELQKRNHQFSRFIKLYTANPDWI